MHWKIFESSSTFFAGLAHDVLIKEHSHKFPLAGRFLQPHEHWQRGRAIASAIATLRKKVVSFIRLSQYGNDMVDDPN